MNFPTALLALSTLIPASATSDAMPADLGRVGGPGFELVRVSAYATRVYHVMFRGDETARISVRGDGDTDLDLFVYDEHGHLIAQDSDHTDYCVVSWTPRWTGMFRVEVRNLGGVFNQYRLQTN